MAYLTTNDVSCKLSLPLMVYYGNCHLHVMRRVTHVVIWVMIIMCYCPCWILHNGTSNNTFMATVVSWPLPWQLRSRNFAILITTSWSLSRSLRSITLIVMINMMHNPPLDHHSERSLSWSLRWIMYLSCSVWCIISAIVTILIHSRSLPQQRRCIMAITSLSFIIIIITILSWIHYQHGKPTKLIHHYESLCLVTKIHQFLFIPSVHSNDLVVKILNNKKNTGRSNSLSCMHYLLYI